MKLLNEQSDEQEVREFLDAHFRHLDDASAQRFAEQNNFLRKARRESHAILRTLSCFRASQVALKI